MSSTEINTAIELLESKIGETDDLKPQLEAMTKLGEVVSRAIGQMPGLVAPLAGDLRKLGNVIVNLGINSYDCPDFCSKFIVPTSVLTSFMKNALENPNEENFENFKLAYTMSSPLMLGYTLAAYLEQDSINPIKVAMREKKDKRTFDKLANMIVTVIGQITMLEAFANGLIGNRNEFNLNLLVEKTREATEMIEVWRKEYGI